MLVGKFYLSWNYFTPLILKTFSSSYYHYLKNISLTWCLGTFVNLSVAYYYPSNKAVGKSAGGQFFMRPWRDSHHTPGDTGIGLTAARLNIQTCFKMLLRVKCNGSWRQYAKWNKSDRERQRPYDLTHVRSQNKQKGKTKKELIDTENRSVVVRWVKGIEKCTLPVTK